MRPKALRLGEGQMDIQTLRNTIIAKQEAGMDAWEEEKKFLPPPASYSR